MDCQCICRCTPMCDCMSYYGYNDIGHNCYSETNKICVMAKCCLCSKITSIQNSYCNNCKCIHWYIKCGKCHLTYCNDCNNNHIKEYGRMYNNISDIKNVSNKCILCSNN